MIKFYHKLLIILTTITVVSFLLLGFIVHNSIYTKTVEYEKKSLLKDAEQILAFYKEGNKRHIQELANHYQSNIKIIENNQTTTYKGDRNLSIAGRQDSLLRKLQLSDPVYQLDGKHGYYWFGHQQGDTTILMTGHFDMVYELQLQFWKYLILVGMIILALIFFTVRYINRTYIQPINEVSYAASLLTEGNFRVRLPESSVKELRELYVTINVLARRLEQLKSEQKIQRNRLVTTLENIPSAILMIDKNGKIVIANKTFYEIFNVSTNVENQNYEHYLHPTIKQLVVEGFRTEKAMYKQVEISINHIHQKFFDTSCVPILSRTKKSLQGMVIVLHDITQLKKLENLRSEFVANVSHELKTPITSMKGFTETLIDGAKNDEASLDMFLNIILKESNRIQTLVEDLLDLSKIEQNTTLEKHMIDLSDVAKSSFSVIQPLANEKSIQLIDQIEPNVIAMADENKISQVIVNLMSNAVNYSPENRTVTLAVYRENQHPIIEVIDQGIGISEEEKYRIFERFYRVDKARSRDSGGTGLGLSITKHIIEAYQGNIEVESELGKGSKFKVVLPE
ncbi:two-component system histidine kinase PnpS [Staphylococcus intermedius]|uniref:Sensor protein kinase WalK n=1 Tax=Staphylococcus intermedius NCTC 11048 TaxID=1141106 RepID=A0A380G833_STAIN|nr:HAMP domain-containing sensor histidine kinase [Staphylococcus intermedius]PCF64692.1 PAS domain-containing sensor histidine kinase [Staphylococcus intermedius]PCF80302.1 PAS domain-containing sensor histidine kinase [Staphylococcus intermedius]PCF81652.1 PAS domain-containing sensor histidine kinase [Staphylococcus intermedius]PCF87989.1 PAS domain-containing sensor histidine kinase [Staphylococcus intermedius]PCF88702.1 PAS domain-containing sensor histidine kinase [Staphylococcus interme